MTHFIGEPGQAATGGEKRLFRRIKHAFGDEPGMYCYTEPAIGDDRPDFVLMDPSFGIIVIEVKDYGEQTIVELSGTGSWLLDIDGQETRCANPFQQVYGYWRAIQCHFAKWPVHQVVVLSNVSEKSDAGRHVIGVAPARVSVLFREHVASLAGFKEHLLSRVPIDPATRLTPDEFNLLRGNLVPTSRLPKPTRAAASTATRTAPRTRQARLRFDDPVLDKDELQLLDAEQERLACNVGDGHRLFFGVAGSGKTVILVARARYLARIHPGWRILLVCFNRLLARYLQQLINPQDFAADIVVTNYHKLAKGIITSAGPPHSIEYNTKLRECEASRGDTSSFFTDVVPALFDRVVKERGQHLQFDAILVDEAQDFEPHWYAPLLGLLNPATQSLLVTLDGLQGIYARKRFYWSDVGIKARGRVVKLQRTYRNPAVIGKAARLVLPGDITGLIGTGDEFLDTREYARGGGTVDVIIEPGKHEQYERVAAMVKENVDKGLSTIVAFRHNVTKWKNMHPVFHALARHGIDPASAMHDDIDGRLFLVATPYSMKGLEADVVIVPEADEYVSGTDRQLLYVAMTRATRSVTLLAGKPNPLVDSITSASREHHGL